MICRNFTTVLVASQRFGLAIRLGKQRGWSVARP